jgi:hypothetical protein
MALCSLEKRAPTAPGAGDRHGAPRRERRSWGLHFGLHMMVGGGGNDWQRRRRAAAFGAHRCGVWSNELKSKGRGGVRCRLGVLLGPFYMSDAGQKVVTGS